MTIKAYNAGICGYAKGEGGGVQKKSERGVHHMDMQWNALNFEYWVSRDGGDNYIKKTCTNRLSFYIESFHGARVFPNNIRSQLALLLWRNKHTLTNPDGSTNEALLAVAIRKVMPRLLRAAALEVYQGRVAKKKNKQCSDEYEGVHVYNYSVCGAKYVH